MCELCRLQKYGAPNYPVKKILECKGCPTLKKITIIPDSLIYLDVRGCENLESISGLPDTLIYFSCNSCKNLKNIDKLPHSLYWLYCFDNPRLTKLPVLPASLKRLNCHHTKITDLGIIPSNLEYLNCNYSSICFLRNIPISLYFFNFSGCCFIESPAKIWHGIYACNWIKYYIGSNRYNINLIKLIKIQRLFRKAYWKRYLTKRHILRKIVCADMMKHIMTF